MQAESSRQYVLVQLGLIGFCQILHRWKDDVKAYHWWKDDAKQKIVKYAASIISILTKKQTQVAYGWMPIYWRTRSLFSHNSTKSPACAFSSTAGTEGMKATLTTAHMIVSPHWRRTCTFVEFCPNIACSQFNLIYWDLKFAKILRVWILLCIFITIWGHISHNISYPQRKTHARTKEWFLKQNYGKADGRP